jgi:hypothetical protein
MPGYSGGIASEGLCRRRKGARIDRSSAEGVPVLVLCTIVLHGALACPVSGQHGKLGAALARGAVIAEPIATSKPSVIMRPLMLHKTIRGGPELRSVRGEKKQF